MKKTYGKKRERTSLQWERKWQTSRRKNVRDDPFERIILLPYYIIWRKKSWRWCQSLQALNNFFCREVFCPSSGKSLVWSLGKQSKKFKKRRSHAKSAAKFKNTISTIIKMWSALPYSLTFTTTYYLPPQYKTKGKSLTQYVDCDLRWFATFGVNCDIIQKRSHSECFLDTLNAVIIKIRGKFLHSIFSKLLHQFCVSFPTQLTSRFNLSSPFFFLVVVEHKTQEASDTKVGARNPLTRDVFICR